MVNVISGGINAMEYVLCQSQAHSRNIHGGLLLFKFDGV